MADQGRILLADDEETFLNSTADLLRREGYHCDCVPDAPSAAAKLKDSQYDLLIADIKMPGNPDLELIHEVKSTAEGLQVILVTGYPSMNSAIDCVTLPVVAYVVKPLDFDNFLAHVRAAVERSKIYRAVSDTQRHLLDWHRNLEDIRHLMYENPGDTLLVPIDSFVTLTLQNIITRLASLKSVTGALTKLSGEQSVCQLFDCPRTDALIDIVKESIEILRKTKGAFKSKELGELRHKLEGIVEKEG